MIDLDGPNRSERLELSAMAQGARVLTEEIFNSISQTAGPRAVMDPQQATEMLVQLTSAVVTLSMVLEAMLDQEKRPAIMVERERMVLLVRLNEDFNDA